MKETQFTTTMSEKLKDQLVGEALVCGLLGKVFYTYPERPWLQSLIDDSIFEEVPFGGEETNTIAGLTLLRDWSESTNMGMSDDEFAELLADYTRLFIGPSKVVAPPWESVYVSYSALTFQEETLDVRRWYARFGLQIEKLHQEPDDHIGLELEFMAHLARSAATAIAEEDPGNFNKLILAQREFACKHLLKWGQVFCRKVETEARTNFYRGIAVTTHGILGAVSGLLEINPIKENE